MKSFYTLLLSLASLLTSTYSVAQGSLAALEKKHGFRDAKVGMPFASFDITPIKHYGEFHPGDYHIYYRLRDSKMLGDIPLAWIKYHFYKGYLKQISILASYADKDAIIETLQTLYGPGEKTLNSYRLWESANVGLLVHQAFEYVDGIPGIEIMYWSRSINAQHLRDEEIDIEKRHRMRILNRQSDL